MGALQALAAPSCTRRRSGILGFGRIGQLVAARARGFGMRVIAFDPFVSEDRYRELGVEKRATRSTTCWRAADFLTIHLPRTPETRGFLNAEKLAKCKDGVVVLNVARGELLVDEDLQAALDSGKVGGAGLDVFQQEPITEHPLFSYPQVVVTPHLGASTAEAQDRAGVQTAEQVVAALTGGVVSTAVNIPAISAEDQELLGPFVPLCRKLGQLAMELAGGTSVETIEAEYLGRIAERDTRFMTLGVLMGALAGRVEDEVNLVNAPTPGRRARHRRARDAPAVAPATSPTSCASPCASGDERRARRRHAGRPPQPPAPARGLGRALQPPARGPHRAVPQLRRARHDRPGRDAAGRARGQHRPDGRRPPRGPLGRVGRDGADDGRARSRARCSTRSSRSTASSTAAPFPSRSGLPQRSVRSAPDRFGP